MFDFELTHAELVLKICYQFVFPFFIFYTFNPFDTGHFGNFPTGKLINWMHLCNKKNSICLVLFP